MEQFRKVNSLQLYTFWKNLSVGLLMIIAMMTFTKLLPFYISPVISLACAAILFSLLYNNKFSSETSCALIPYCIFYCFISYSFISIVINVLYAWGIIIVPPETIFFNYPYVPSLLMMPISFITMLILYARRKSLRICVDCVRHNGEHTERGQLGKILRTESVFQMRNLIILFGSISVIIWTYYLLYYVNISLNARDWYVFTWLTIIAFILDEVYFLFRYYNLYLDLKESNEIISEEEVRDMTAKTYLRFYVICENNIFVDTRAIDPSAPYKEIIDTPFQTKRNVNGISVDEVRRIISNMTGVNGGELKFFFGRKIDPATKRSILRYFYFIEPDENGNPPALRINGEWMDYDIIKKLYVNNPGRLSTLSVSDTTRLAKIILTEKIFDDKGFRKSKIKTYNPTFNLIDVRNSNLDFQDDKWLKIYNFNSDTPMYRLRRWWRDIAGKNSDNSRTWN